MYPWSNPTCTDEIVPGFSLAPVHRTGAGIVPQRELSSEINMYY